jgi:UDP-N-acetylmuramyl pentapeptide synthase
VPCQAHSFVNGVASIDCAGETITIRPGFSQSHNLGNLVAAVALVRGLGMRPPRELEVGLPPLRWQLERLGDAELVLDCFNSSPQALRAALKAFASEPAR